MNLFYHSSVPHQPLAGGVTGQTWRYLGGVMGLPGWGGRAWVTWGGWMVGWAVYPHIQGSEIGGGRSVLDIELWQVSQLPQMLFRLFKSHNSFSLFAFKSSPCEDEFPIVVFVSAAKYTDIQLWIVLSTGLGLQRQHGQSSGLYVCIVIEIGVIFGNYHYHGYLLVTLYYFRICFNCLPACTQ